MTKQAEDAAYAEIPAEWLQEFEAAARRPLQMRVRYAFIQTYKPIMDDVPYRASSTRRQTIAAGAKKISQNGWAMAAFDYRQAEDIRDTLSRYGVRYL